jgi:hypothetical protein
VYQSEGKMNLRAPTRWIATLVLLASTLLGSGASGQAKSLTDQLVGAWSLVSFEASDSAGRKVASIEGRDVKGRAFPD